MHLLLKTLSFLRLAGLVLSFPASYTPSSSSMAGSALSLYKTSSSTSMSAYNVATSTSSTVSSSTSLASYPMPRPCIGLCSGGIHDPSVIRRDDGTYFRFTTANGIGIDTAPDLTGPWVRKGSVLTNGTSIIPMAGNNNPWAPDVSKVGNLYYLYYAISSFGTQKSAIGLATSPSMDIGTWTDTGMVISSKTGDPYNAIDPNLLQVGNTSYLTFGSFWNGIHQVLLDNTLKKTQTSYSTPYQIAYNSTGAHAIEGASIFFRAPFYYLFFSSGQCCVFDKGKPAPGYEYSIRVCRSYSPNKDFIDKQGKSCKDNNGGSIILASHDNIYAAGGQSVFRDDVQRGTVIVYHYLNTTGGWSDYYKSYGWNMLGFGGDLWPKLF